MNKLIWQWLKKMLALQGMLFLQSMPLIFIHLIPYKAISYCTSKHIWSPFISYVYEFLPSPLPLPKPHAKFLEYRIFVL